MTATLQLTDPPGPSLQLQQQPRRTGFSTTLSQKPTVLAILGAGQGVSHQQTGTAPPKKGWQSSETADILKPQESEPNQLRPSQRTPAPSLGPFPPSRPW